MADTLTGADHEAALERDIKTLREDVALLSETLSSLASDSAAAARTAAREGIDRVSAAAEDARERAYAAADDVSATIEQNPLTSVLIALGLGYVIGVLGRRS